MSRALAVREKPSAVDAVSIFKSPNRSTLAPSLPPTLLSALKVLAQRRTLQRGRSSKDARWQPASCVRGLFSLFRLDDRRLKMSYGIVVRSVKYVVARSMCSRAPFSAVGCLESCLPGCVYG